MKLEEAKIILLLNSLYSRDLCHCKEFDEVTNKAEEVIINNIHDKGKAKNIDWDKVCEDVLAKVEAQKIDYDKKTTVKLTASLELSAYQLDYKGLNMNEDLFKDTLARVLARYLGGDASSTWTYKLKDINIAEEN